MTGIKPTAAEVNMNDQETIISILLDIVSDETERIRERLEYLQSLKKRLEDLIPEEEE